MFHNQQEVIHHESIEQVKGYIESRLQDWDLSVTDLADYVGLTSCYLTTLFRKATGLNVCSYITKTRIDRASQLLMLTGFPISTIANSVGYLDYRYFTKVFKKNIGLTPTQYRKGYMEVFRSLDIILAKETPNSIE